METERLNQKPEEEKGRIGLIVGFLTSVLSVGCCAIPVVLVSLGLGGGLGQPARISGPISSSSGRFFSSFTWMGHPTLHSKETEALVQTEWWPRDSERSDTKRNILGGCRRKSFDPVPSVDERPLLSSEIF